jgi:hypothetical protein
VLLVLHEESDLISSLAAPPERRTLGLWWRLDPQWTVVPWWRLDPQRKLDPWWVVDPWWRLDPQRKLDPWWMGDSWWRLDLWWVVDPWWRLVVWKYPHFLGGQYQNQSGVHFVF